MENLTHIKMHHVIQPIMDLCNNQIYGYEFLLRSDQFMNPELLFSHALQQNQLVQLDKKSVFTSLETINQNQTGDYYFFINIFPSTLLDKSFHKSLQQLMSLSNIQPNHIVFEINEAENSMSSPILKEVCNHLKKQGFLIAIDDLGKGFSSIRSILELEPDIVKVDRYLTNQLSQSNKKQQLIEFIIDFVKPDSKVILEGFELKEDIEIAKELGVLLGQGYYFGKPNSIHHYLPNFNETVFNMTN